MVLDGKTFGFKTQVIQKTDLLAVKLENSESTNNNCMEPKFPNRKKRPYKNSHSHKKSLLSFKLFTRQTKWPLFDNDYKKWESNMKSLKWHGQKGSVLNRNTNNHKLFTNVLETIDFNFLCNVFEENDRKLFLRQYDRQRRHHL